MSKDYLLKVPVLLASSHCVDDFDCGNKELNHYLKRFALINNQHRSARTFVVFKARRVIGYLV